MHSIDAARATSFSLLLALAAGKKLKPGHFWVTNAFIQTEIGSDVYVKPPRERIRVRGLTNMVMHMCSSWIKLSTMVMVLNKPTACGNWNIDRAYRQLFLLTRIDLRRTLLVRIADLFASTQRIDIVHLTLISDTQPILEWYTSPWCKLAGRRPTRSRPL